MIHKVLDVVVLARDLPEHGLRSGDLGTVVETYPPDGLELEFVLESGATLALITVSTQDVRPPEADEPVATRRTRR